MGSKIDLQRNNAILGNSAEGLLGGLSKVRNALQDKNVAVPQSGKTPTFDEIRDAIETGVTDLSDTTAQANDVATGKVFYDASGKRTEGSGKLEANFDDVLYVVDLPSDFNNQSDINDINVTFVKNNIGDIIINGAHNTTTKLYYLNKNENKFELLHDTITNKGIPKIHIFDNEDILIELTKPLLFSAKTKRATAISVPVSLSSYVYHNGIIYAGGSGYVYRYDEEQVKFSQVLYNSSLGVQKLFSTKRGLFVICLPSYIGTTDKKAITVYKLNETTGEFDVVFQTTSSDPHYVDTAIEINDEVYFYYAYSYNYRDKLPFHGIYKYNKELNTVEAFIPEDFGYFYKTFISSSGKVYYITFYSKKLYYIDPSTNEHYNIVDIDDVSADYTKFYENSNGDIFIYGNSSGPSGLYVFDESTKTSKKLSYLQDCKKFVLKDYNDETYIMSYDSAYLGCYLYRDGDMIQITSTGYTSNSSNTEQIYIKHIDGFGTFLSAIAMELYYKSDNSDEYIIIDSVKQGTELLKSSDGSCVFFIKAVNGTYIKKFDGTTVSNVHSGSHYMSPNGQLVEYNGYLFVCTNSLKSPNGKIKFKAQASEWDETILWYGKLEADNTIKTWDAARSSIPDCVKGYLEIVDNKLLLRHYDYIGDFEVKTNEYTGRPYLVHLGYGSNKTYAFKDVVSSYRVTSGSFPKRTFGIARNGMVKEFLLSEAGAIDEDGKFGGTGRVIQTSRYWTIFNNTEVGFGKFVYIDV